MGLTGVSEHVVSVECRVATGVIGWGCSLLDGGVQRRCQRSVEFVTVGGFGYCGEVERCRRPADTASGCGTWSAVGAGLCAG